MAAHPVHRPRVALRAASSFPFSKRIVRGCVKPSKPAEARFERARIDGLNSIERSQRSGHLARVIGEVAESVAEMVLDEQGYNLVWQITTPGVHGVDLLFLSPDESVLALEVKGTLRPGTIPRLTPSRLRQMSREWLNDPANPAMAEWTLQADDLCAGVMLVELATPLYRLALSGNFEHYTPVTDLSQLTSLRDSLANSRHPRADLRRRGGGGKDALGRATARRGQISATRSRVSSARLLSRCLRP